MAPDLELIKAALAALREDATMLALVPATAIFDTAPEEHTDLPELPNDYVSVGPTEIVPDETDCDIAAEIEFQLDGWSSGAGEARSSVRVRRMADAMFRCLHGRELALTENALVSIAWVRTRILKDPDGITNHAAVQFTATVETR